jgi:methionyl-tRNA synthetase
MAQAAEGFLGTEFSDWLAVRAPLLDRPLRAYQALATRLDAAAVAALVEPETPAAAPAALPATAARRGVTAEPAAAVAGNIGIEQFARIDLRVARVAEAATVDGSDKLLRLTLELGGGELRTVFSGIRSSYRPEQLLGRLVVVVANLAPRKMRFGVSEGMVLCATDESGAVFLVETGTGAQPGMKVS